MVKEPDRSGGGAPLFKVLLPGDPAPTFKCRISGGDLLALDVLAGRYLVLCVFVTARDEDGARMLAASRRCIADLGRGDVTLAGLSVDGADLSSGRLSSITGPHVTFVDPTGEAGRAYGALPIDTPSSGATVARRIWYVIDPNMRIRDVIEGAQAQALERLRALLVALPEADRFAGPETPAPVLLLPRVLEPDLCRELVSLYDRDGGRSSGFMVERDGITVGRNDPAHKVRSDCTIEDEGLKVLLQRRIRAKVFPQIEKVHHFHCTRMERYIVACYDAAEGGHFRAHRDNTTRGTAHRRFAVSLNLNDDYDGGTIHFPEFGSRGYRIPMGGAVVFSCSLLHAVSRVTRGRRYAFLPFLYDEPAARIREANNGFLHESVGAYDIRATGRADRSPATAAAQVETGR